VVLQNLPCRHLKRQCVFAGILTAPAVPPPKDGKKKARKPLKELEQLLLKEVKDYFKTYDPLHFRSALPTAS
jgi:hypothetical protein